MAKEVFNLSNRERSYLNLAIKVAASSSMRQRHGAVIVKGGRVLSVGINKFRNDPMSTVTERIKTDCSIHAEIDAMSRCDPRGASVYIARLNNSNNVRYSRPCESCYDALRAAKVKKIVWTEDGE